MEIFQTQVMRDKGTLRLLISDGITITGKRPGVQQENLDIPDDMEAAYGEADGAWQMFTNSLQNGHGGAAAFIRSIVDGKPGEPSFEDGYKAQQIIK